MDASLPGSSTFEGLCRVTRPNGPPGGAGCLSRATGRSLMRVSIMGLPVITIPCAGRPSVIRFSLASGLVISIRSEIWSVRIRFISSGIVLSPLRRPDSTWQTGIPCRTATRAQARVELTSPTTTVISGSGSGRDSSYLCITVAVWTVMEAEPTPRFTSGLGRPSSSKKDWDIAWS
ncbi:MAG: hypothetical protein BWX47_00829 [candidate division Hyd24-12 bacterium ADurb.Bin004]|nr:MAG: hypothetical protein BWX47_00829 [candidate division Hyd24-12 bacterium ADurb.Bin004]